MRGYSIQIAGCFVLTVKYLQKRKGTFFFRRGVPKELRSYFKGRLEIVESLHTSDEALAVKLIQEKTKYYEREFAKLQSTHVRDSAVARLEAYGLEPRRLSEQPTPIDPDDPDDDGSPYHVFVDALANKYDAGGYYNPTDQIDQRALDILHGTEKLTLADARDEFIRLEHAQDNKKKLDTINNHFRQFENNLNTNELDRITRRMVQAAVHQLAESGLKSGSIKRYLGTVRKAVDLLYTAYEIEKNNPFSGVKIPKLGHDTEKRHPFTYEELKHLQLQILRNLHLVGAQVAGLLFNTGCRISEVGGLMLEDLQVDADIPHLVIKEAPNRSLKTANSARVVPLIGLSLQVARTLKGNAKKGDSYVFERYNKMDILNQNACSNATNKFIRNHSLRGTRTTHSFRHTLTDRLKAASIPEGEIENILGWATKKMVAYYGKGRALETLHCAMEKTIEHEIKNNLLDPPETT